jgi:hypothetical protein
MAGAGVLAAWEVLTEPWAVLTEPWAVLTVALATLLLVVTARVAVDLASLEAVDSRPKVLMHRPDR